MADAQPVGDRILTVPNALSVVRLAFIPLFLYLFLVTKADGWAVIVLMISGFTDWADGKIARLMNQSSHLGMLLDPAADRLYMLATPIAFAIRGVIPWWLILTLMGRDLILTLALPIVRSRGIEALPVIYIGKAATFALMSAFPLVLVGQWDSWWARIIGPCGWAFLIWGLGMYLWTFVLYLAQVVMIVRTLPRVGPKTDPKGSTSHA